MRLYNRQNEILAAVKSRGACSIVELAAQLKVSDETIRRNIKPLVRQGLVEKVHGGIVFNQALVHEPPFERRMNEHIGEKQQTTAYVARALGEHRNLSVVTNCTEIARTLAREPSNRVHICGGPLRSDDWATFGSSAISFVRQFHVSFAILSIGGVTDTGEFVDYHLEEAEFSRAVIQQARKTIVVADHSKFGSRSFVKVCDFEQVDILVADRLPPGDILAGLDDAGIEVITPEGRE